MLERNRFYHGKRPHHVDRFVFDLTVDRGSAVDQVAAGTTDTLVPFGPIADRSDELAQRYGINKSQFFVIPGNGIRLFHLNTRRPLFRNNLKLRRAVNFAIDRKAVAREDGVWAVTPTDQYQLRGAPEYRDQRIYPLKGPALRRARALAAGHTRSGKATPFTTTSPNDIAQAQILRRNLEAIGLDLEIKHFPGNLFDEVQRPGAAFDLARVRWFVGLDPSYLNCLFDGRGIGQRGTCNFSFFNSRKYNGLLERASRLTGADRYRVHGELDVQLSRDAATAIPVARVNALSFVSARVGCVVVNPFLDLTAACLM
jgi:ABC-type transport system substrate-binding protein